MGLPCPNIFAGGHNFHGKYEYLPVESMGKSFGSDIENNRTLYPEKHIKLSFNKTGKAILGVAFSVFSIKLTQFAVLTLKN